MLIVAILTEGQTVLPDLCPDDMCVSDLKQAKFNSGCAVLCGLYNLLIRRDVHSALLQLKHLLYLLASDVRHFAKSMRSCLVQFIWQMFAGINSLILNRTLYINDTHKLNPRIIFCVVMPL